jgi:hypothetical protein
MLIEDLIESIAFTVGKDKDVPFKAKLRVDIISARSVVLKRELEKKKFLPSYLKQTVHCIKLKRIDNSTCVDCDGFNNEVILETVCTIPEPLDLRKDLTTFKITTPFIKTYKHINILDDTRVFIRNSSRFSKNEPYARWENKKIQLFNVSAALEYISFYGFFNNPFEVEDLKSCCYKEIVEDCDDCNNSLTTEACKNKEVSTCFDNYGSLIIEEEYGYIIKELIYKELSMFNQNVTDTDIEVNEI